MDKMVQFINKILIRIGASLQWMDEHPILSVAIVAVLIATIALLANLPIHASTRMPT